MKTNQDVFYCMGSYDDTPCNTAIRFYTVNKKMELKEQLYLMHSLYELQYAKRHQSG